MTISTYMKRRSALGLGRAGLRPRRVDPSADPRTAHRAAKGAGPGYLFFSHDLAVVHRISHRVAVMYKGKLVDQGSTQQIFDDPRHAYTKTLLSSTPNIGKAEVRA